MHINLLVKPNCRKKGIEKLPDGSYRVSVHAPAHEGLANEAVIALLADYFECPKSAIQIVKGLRGKKKWVEIVD